MPFRFVFSQTTYDYFEKLRLERKEKKIKIVSAFDYADDVLSKKEYYDENGLLTKYEIYGASYFTGGTYMYHLIIVNKYSEKGQVSGTITKFESDGSKTDFYEFNNLKPEVFFDIKYEGDFYSDVQYVFDNSGNLSEKRFYNQDMYKPGEYEKEILIYDSDNKIIQSKYTSPGGGTTVSIGKYYYNSDGLLEHIDESYDFQNGGRNFDVRYEYEFY